jgi:hypothetical protein
MLNWKNVQYANGSGLVNAIRDNNNQITKGNQQIIDSISQFGEDRTKLKTDNFISSLMALDDEKERQALIAGADKSFLDLDAINTSNKAANAFADWERKFVMEQAGRERVADIQSKKDLNIKGYGKTSPGKSFKDALGGFDDSWTGFSHGFDQDDQQELNDKKTYVTGKWGKGSDADIKNTISEKDWNAWSTQRLRFKDEFFDDFEFTHNGKAYDLDDAPDNILKDAIMKFKGSATDLTKLESIGFEKFLNENPELKGDKTASDKFKETDAYNKILFEYNKTNK